MNNHTPVIGVVVFEVSVVAVVNALVVWDRGVVDSEGPADCAWGVVDSEEPVDCAWVVNCKEPVDCAWVVVDCEKPMDFVSD